jgi:hypothetical protein
VADTPQEGRGRTEGATASGNVPPGTPINRNPRPPMDTSWLEMESIRGSDDLSAHFRRT